MAGYQICFVNLLYCKYVYLICDTIIKYYLLTSCIQHYSSTRLFDTVSLESWFYLPYGEGGGKVVYPTNQITCLGIELELIRMS